MSSAVIVLRLMQLLGRNFIEPTLSSVTSGAVIVVLPISNSSLRIGRILSCELIVPLECHYAILIERILVTIDGLGNILAILSSICLYSLTIGIEVEPIILLFLILSTVKSGLNLIINYMKLCPSGNLCTVISGTAVVYTIFPAFVVSYSVAVAVNPAPKHLALVIEGVLLAVDGLERDAVSIRSGISFTVVLEVVPYVLGVVLIVHIFIL